MYLADGELSPDFPIPVRAVGWLDELHPYTRGQVPARFVRRLATYCAHPNIGEMGFHDCPFCQSAVRRSRPRIEERTLGSGVIVAFHPNGTRYAAPNLVYHYVTEHGYRPPDAFVKAISRGPLPPSPLYQERMEREIFFADEPERRPAKRGAPSMPGMPPQEWRRWVLTYWLQRLRWPLW